MRISIRLCIVALTLTAAYAVAAPPLHLTMYSDGRSCPADCDAHVVFHRSLNGTAYAHAPGSTPQAPAKCTVGQSCRLCLTGDDTQCLLATYRGGGPAPMRLDFTPAFFEQACADPQRPPLLEATCADIRAAAARLAGRTNCIRTPSAPACAALMAQAEELRRADTPLYEECMRIGEARFNAARPRSERRSLECSYEAHGTGGPNSRGQRWKRLLPGACRPGTFVGRDGLDCCSGNTFADGPLGRECRAFYPE